MNRIALLACGVLLPATLSACDVLDPGVCTTDVHPAIVVQVRDAATQAPAASGATGVVRDGSFTAQLRQTLPGENALELRGAEERAGTYTVTIDKPGYQQWKQERVRVRDGSCHVQTVTLQASLVRVP
ncbi:MAG TPA: hypothetical protein VHG08_05800 [Longimicrobium sp.]|nr:hypothetical protein [Longimicrobium sp.]